LQTNRALRCVTKRKGDWTGRWTHSPSFYFAPIHRRICIVAYTRRDHIRVILSRHATMHLVCKCRCGPIVYVDNCGAQRRHDPACGRQSKLRILTKGQTLIISASLYRRPLSIPDSVRFETQIVTFLLANSLTFYF